MTVWRFAKKQLLQSMLTGLPQIIGVRGRLRKFLKSLVVLGCLLGCVYQILSFMRVYWSYPVIVDVFVSNPSHITPPAFTVCEYNGIRRSKFCSKFPDLCTPKMSYLDFCTRNFAFCRGSPTEPTNEKIPAIPPNQLPTNFSGSRASYRNMGTFTGSFLNYATFGEEELGPKLVSVFNIQGLPTNCFAFNVVWGNGSATLTNSRQRTGFEISLEMHGGEDFYASTPKAIQMAVHSPLIKINPFTEGFSIRPCTTYKMFLQKTQKYLLPAPYPTNCTDYESLWRERGGHGPLNKEMCFEECLFNRSMEKYGCFNPTEVTYPNDNDPFCYSDHNLEEEINDCSNECQSACYEEEMEVKIEEMVFSDTEENRKSDKCITILALQFARTQVMTFTYSQKYQAVEAFGSIGGLLGMWMGLSLIAVCDFLETCLMIAKYACTKAIFSRRRRKIKQENYSKKNFVYHM